MIRKHKLIWSARYEVEHTLVMAECKRVAALGGSFEIENRYCECQWTSFFTLYYPDSETESSSEASK